MEQRKTHIDFLKSTLYLLSVLLAFGLTSCNLIVKNSKDVLGGQTQTITYGDYSIDIDKWGRVIHLDPQLKRMTGHYIVTREGTVYEELDLSDGFLDGIHLTYNSEGGISAEKTYSDGILDGPETTFHVSGALKSEAVYEKGKLIGKETTYTPSGEISSVREFDEHNVEYNSHYENGRMITTDFKKNIDGAVYDLTVFYDITENIKLIFGRREYQEKSSVFYVFDENFELIEAVNPQKNPEKAAAYFQQLGSLFN